MLSVSLTGVVNLKILGSVGTGVREGDGIDRDKTSGQAGAAGKKMHDLI